MSLSEGHKNYTDLCLLTTFLTTWLQSAKTYRVTFLPRRLGTGEMSKWIRNFPIFRSEREKRSTSGGTPKISNGISGNFLIHLISNRNFRVFRANGKHPGFRVRISNQDFEPGFRVRISSQDLDLGSRVRTAIHIS